MLNLVLDLVLYCVHTVTHVASPSAAFDWEPVYHARGWVLR
jgi:hypothetical protein